MTNYSSEVIPILKEAGKELKKYFGKTEVIGQKTNSACDVVTDLDLKTEKFIAGKLKKIFPDIDYVGEEFGGNDKAERFWLVDPIDGTSHFVRGIPFCTTMIALIESGKAVFSAIFDFTRNEAFWAEKGRGAKKNNKSIHVSERNLASAYLVYETHFDKRKNLDLLAAIREKAVLFKTISCGYEFSLIAQGKIEGRVTFDSYGTDHDYAAGAFLVEEAGGIVRNIGKNSYNYRNHDFVAVNPLIEKELRESFGL
jgi:myo-inositol-1(or 4)-monophosphatase